MTLSYVLPMSVKCLKVVAVAHVEYTKNANIDGHVIVNPSNFRTSCFKPVWIYK